MKRLLKYIVGFIALIILSVVLINAHIVNTSKDYIFEDLDDLPEKQAVIVLGALVRGDRLSDVLKDRVDAGVYIYQSGKATKLLLSGDHGRKEYDEVNGMRKYIIQNAPDIKPDDIFMDHAGFDTYDTMYRAREIFQVESAVIVTQDFHINRAVFIANELGIDAIGYAVDESRFPTSVQKKWRIRETLSRVKAFGDVLIQSKPTYLGETIPITGDGRLSWD